MKDSFSKLVIVTSIFALLLSIFVFLFDNKANTVESKKLVNVLTDDSRCPENMELTNAIVSKSLKISEQRLQALKDSRSLDNHDLCFMPALKLAKAFQRLDTPKTEGAAEWVKYRKMQQMSDNGEVKPSGLAEAILFRQEMLKNDKKLFRRGGINKTKWQSIGPGNIGGRIRSILIHPTQPNKMWVGSVSGGIWQTKNGGQSWSPVNDFMGNLSITSLVMDPTDTNIIYAATGEGFTYSFKGAGIFKSIDGGETWKQLPATKPTKNNWKYVNRIAIHPNQSNILLAATNNGLFRSTDYGDSWKQLKLGYHVYDVKFNPNNGQYATASTRKYNKQDGTSTYSIFYSSSLGKYWSSDAIDYKGRVELAYSNTRQNYVYASVDDEYGKVYRSKNNGKTWQFLAHPKHLGNQGWYDNTIWVDPTDAQHLIIGGIGLYYSTNGGLNWQLLRKKWNSWGIHSDHHAIVSHPDFDGINNNVIFFGNDGGIYKSSNIRGENTPVSLNNHLSITQFYTGAGHDGKNQRIIGGTQDNGTLIYLGQRNKWTWFEGGDGSGTAINPNNGNYIYGAVQFLNLYRSTDGGERVRYICEGIKDLRLKQGSENTGYACNDGSGDANFISHFILDPNNPNCLIAGAYSLWRSCNVNAKKPQWNNIKPAISKDGEYKYWKYINTLAMTKKNSNVIWVGHNNGKLYRTHNGKAKNPSWQRKGEDQLPKRMSLSLLIDNKNTNKIYASFGGYEADNLYMSQDDGNTWKSISKGLPKSPIYTVQQHPKKQGWLYVGTEVGVFTSENGGKTWTAVNDGPANVPVFQLFWLNDYTLVAVTHGRGMFTVTVGDKISNTVLLPPKQLKPKNIISSHYPFYQWLTVDNVNQYELHLIQNEKVIFQKKLQANKVCNQDGYCYFSSPISLKKGHYRWRIRSYQGTKKSAWRALKFEIDPSKKPQKAKLLKPSGNITTQKPWYRWTAAKRASHYYLRVSDSSLKLDYENQILGEWYSAEELGCDNSQECSIKPNIALPRGKHRWWVLSYNRTGFGDWSEPMTINVSNSALLAPKQIMPKNIISYNYPFYQWLAVDNVNQYEIHLIRNEKVIFQIKLQVSNTCNQDGDCYLSSPISLKKGHYRWRIRSYQGTKKSAWRALRFEIDPSKKPQKAKLLKPGGNITTQKPWYRWTAAKRASHYYLRVSDSSLKLDYENQILGEWYSAEELGCDNTQECSIKPNIALPLGKHRWKVGTYNQTGWGYWSEPKTITVQ